MFSIRFDLYLGRNVTPKRFVDSISLDAFLTDEVTSRFPGFTLTDTVGFWEGKQEQTVILTVYGNVQDCGRVAAIAAAYKERFSQDAVLVSETNIQGRLV